LISRSSLQIIIDFQVSKSFMYSL